MPTVSDAGSAAPGAAAPPPTVASLPVRAPGVLSRSLRRADVLAVPLVILVSWQVLAWWLGASSVASPRDTIKATRDGFSHGWLAEAYMVTLWGAALSFALAAIAGFALGMFMGLSRFWGDVLEPPVLWFYSVPKVTLYPVFLLVLGLTVETRVVFAAMHGFIPLALFIFSGVRGVPNVYRKTAKAWGLNRVQTIRRVIVPATIPSIMVGLQYCFSLTFIALVFAELFAATEGTGRELLTAISLHRVPDSFAIAALLVATAILVNSLFNVAVNRLERGRGTKPT